MGVRFAIRTQQIKRWPTVEAVITTKRVKVTQQKGKTRKRQYEVDLEYKYVVDGRTYISQNYAPVKVIDTRHKIEKELDEIPQRPIVLFNPQKPSESYYRHSPHSLTYVFIIAGIFCLTILYLA